MLKRFRPYNLDQQLLLPPDMRPWLPEGHLVLFILDVVAVLDLASIYEAYEVQLRGRPPYDPTMMVALLLYAYCMGNPSSRKIERATHVDVAYRVLKGDQHPDHDTIASFRKRHLDALAALFTQILLLCQEAGLVKLGHVSLDGTKVKANASKHKAMSYKRMCETEKKLEEEVKRLLEKAGTTDRAEDEAYGKGQRGDDLPAELARRETRLAKIREAKAALEEQAEDKAAEKAKIQRAKIEARARADERQEAAQADAAASQEQPREAPRQGVSGQRLLRRRQRDGRQPRESRPVRPTEPPETRSDTRGDKRGRTARRVGHRYDAAQAQDARRSGDLLRCARQSWSPSLGKSKRRVASGGSPFAG